MGWSGWAGVRVESGEDGRNAGATANYSSPIERRPKIKSKMEKQVSGNVSMVFREQRVMLKETEQMKMVVSKV